MKKEGNDERRELKYCEHCGGLWLRSPGSGLVYCEQCRAKVADLPVPKKKPGRVRLKLPVGPHTVLEEYSIDEQDDLKAAGGAA